MSLLPESGTGRARLVDHVQLRIGILRGISQFLERLTDAEGALVCPRHRVEHTGKVVYGALVNLALWRYTREDDWLLRGKRQVLRAVDHLGIDPESKVPVFLPGRTDPANASTNAIDGGACADVIATLLEEVPALFDADEQARCAEALERHVEGYLRHAARDRPITAQRLWAGTGVARAARLLRRDDWAADALAGCRLALDELAPDGISPYIPAGSDHCTHPGLADTSGFYHSRTPGFVLYIHEVLGVGFDERARERLAASLDALVALRDGNGRKVLADEAKAWYWESAYEVASHPFDVYALHTGAKVLGRPLYSNEAGRAFEEWIAHIDPLDGGASSHHGRGTNFQCRVFWSGHAAWLTRIIDDCPVRAEPREPVDIELPATGLLHVERPTYTAVLRGDRRPHGHLFGCDVGGGSLQSLVVRPAPAPLGEELVRPQRFAARREGSFLVRPAGGGGRLGRLLAQARAERGDLRFRLYVASVEWRAGRWLGAPLYVLRHLLLRPWRDATSWRAAHWDVGTRQAWDGEQIVFRGGVADRDGRRVPGVETERTYRFLPEGVELVDVLRARELRGAVHYLLPARLHLLDARAEGAALRRRGRRLVLRATGRPIELHVHGRWVVADASSPG